MNKEITWKSYNYCRKSTDVDDKQQNSLDHQIESCKRTAKKYWLEIYKETIESKSAKTEFKREWFNEMIKICKKWVVDYIICDEPKRLSRNNIDSSRIIDLMDKKQIKWVLTSAREYFTKNPRDKFFLQFDLSLWKMDNEDRGIDVNAKMITAFQKWKRMWKAPIWYKNRTIRKGHKDIIVDDEIAPYIKKAFELRIAWYSYSKLSDFFAENWIRTSSWRKFSRERVKKILNDTFYFWLMKWNNLEKKWNHEPLITEEVYYKATEHNKKYTVSNKKRKYNLAWMIRDEKWNTLSWYIKKWKYVYYHTQERSELKINISEKLVLDSFWELLKDFKLPHPLNKITVEMLKDIYKSVNKTIDVEAEKVKLEIDKLKNRKSILFDKYLDWEVEEADYKEKAKEIENRIREEYLKIPKEIEISDEKLNKIEMYGELLVDLYTTHNILYLDEKVNILKSLKGELLITQEKELQIAESKLLKLLKKLSCTLWYPERDSNPHDRSQGILSPPCIPFHHPGLVVKQRALELYKKISVLQILFCSL